MTAPYQKTAKTTYQCCVCHLGTTQEGSQFVWLLAIWTLEILEPLVTFTSPFQIGHSLDNLPSQFLLLEVSLEHVIYQNN